MVVVLSSLAMEKIIVRSLEKFDLPWEESIWRYMKPERLIEFLEDNKLYFSPATAFEDKFEGSITILQSNPNFSPSHQALENAFSSLKRTTKINCWHIEKYESSAMWKLYAGNNKGVAITSTPKKLNDYLKPYRIKPQYGIEDLWGGKVIYKDLTQNRLTLSTLERFYYKHVAFSWEKEFRLSISLTFAEESGVIISDNGIKVNADIGNLINELWIGPSIEKIHKDKIVAICSSLGLEDKIKYSCFFGHPGYA